LRLSCDENIADFAHNFADSAVEEAQEHRSADGWKQGYRETRGHGEEENRLRRSNN